MGFAHGHIFNFAGQWIKHPEYGVKILSGWDPNPEYRRESCAGFNIEEANSADDLLNREDIDAVVITAQTAFHAELAVKAARAKKKIILYKPMALTMAQADKIVEAVEQNGADFTMAWQMRTDPVNEQIRQLICGEEMGRPYFFRRRHCLGMHTNPGFQNTWHVDKDMNRDIFVDDSAHAVDWLYSLFGMPETVSCELATMDNPKVPNDTGVALFRYKNGLIAEIMFSSSCSAAELTTEIYFKKGALMHYGGDAPSLRLPHENMPSLKWFIEGEGDWRISEIPLPPDQGARIGAQAKPLAEFLKGERGPLCTAEEGRDSLRMVLACCLSSREGRRVSLNDERIYDV